MKISAKLLVSLAAVLSASAFGQNRSLPPAGEGAQNGSSPVAYVYVSTAPGNGKYLIMAYAANSSGKLTPVAGSPFAVHGTAMALTSKWFFTTNGVNIYTSSISSTGALKPVSSINAQKHNAGDLGGPDLLVLDHTGSTLYDWDFNSVGTGNNSYQSFDVNSNTGALSYTGATSGSASFYGSIS